MRNHIEKIVALLAFVSIGSLAALAAQPGPTTTTPPPSTTSEDGTVTLSPFEVTTSKDTGYQATETLAGTRIRTDLRDVGAAIQVITKEFLQDLGATNSQSLLLFTTNTEVAGTLSTFANVTPSAAGADEMGNLRAPAGAQRIR